MSVEKSVPEIRFKGFSGEWINSVLGENARFTKGQGYSKGDLIASGSPIILYGRLYTRYQTVINGVDTFVNEKVKPLKSIGGEVIVPASGESPEDISRASVVNDSDVILGGDLNVIYPNKKIDPVFLALAISNGRIKKELSSKAQGKSVVHIRNSDLADLSLILPSETPEQTQIGNTFQKLDNLINQHQQKHDKLSNVKKAMLEKMFPKQGETMPEIRFGGFGGEWEVKELSQVSDKITEKNTSLVYSETFTNSAEFGIISQRDYFDNDISNSNNIGGYYVVQPEDFVYNPRISTFAPCGPINRNTLGRAGVMSPLYSVFRTKGVNTIFIEYFFQTKLWHAFMFLNGDTGARADRFSIKDSVFFELPLLLPTVNEQSVIGNTFQKLDNLINQHQQKHDKLSNIKKAMLEKMFPKQGETIPEIRFKGFSGEWKTSTLGSLVSFYKGKGLPKSSIQYDGIYSCVHYGELFTKYSEVIDLVTSRTNQSDSFFSMSNDVLMPTSGVTPKGLVKPCCVKQSGVVLGGDILVIRPNNQNIIDGSFLSRFIRAREQQVLQNVTGSTVFHLYASSIEGLGIVFPSIDEQTAISSYFQKLDALINQHQQQITKLNNIKQACLSKMFVLPSETPEQTQIGNYFEKLDSLINQYQQKHDRLINIKKAMLEKMFPKQGETMPEIRFKGFSGEWEEKKLGEIGSFASGVGFSESEQSGRDGIPFFKVSDMNLIGNDCYMVTANNYVNDEQISRLNYTPIRESSILFAKVGAAIFLERKRIAKDFLIDNNMMAFSPTQELIFMKQWFDSISLAKYTQVGALPSFKASDLGKIKLKIPKREEQTVIGNYFQKLDVLINQHQQQITKLTNIKQACLSKMFV